MIRILEDKQAALVEPPWKYMCEMEPLECGEIIEDGFGNMGHVVMRTMKEGKCFEVMDLTKGSPGGCWNFTGSDTRDSDGRGLKVTPLKSPILLELK